MKYNNVSSKRHNLIYIMTQAEKASDRLDAINIEHSIMGDAIVLSVWSIDREGSYDFFISQQEVEYYANEYDNQNQ